MANPFLTAPPKTSATKDSAAANELLRSLGRSVGSGAAAVGNTLNKPSRALWGSLNYLAGGKSGGGLLNLLPFSDTMGLTDPQEGIEASGFLANQGVIPQNDPNKLEAWDFGRGLLDIAGDPLSSIAPLSLTGKGAGLAAKGALSSGLLKQITRGERGLVGLQLPFTTKPLGTAFTGKGAAKALRGAGQAVSQNPVGRAVGKVADPAFRQARQWFDSRVANTFTKVGQDTSQAARKTYDSFRFQADADIFSVARELERSGAGPDSAAVIREFAETGKAARTLTPQELKAAELAKTMPQQIADLLRREGAPLHILDDPAQISYLTRRLGGDRVESLFGAGTKAMRAVLSKADKARLGVFKGITSGTSGLNRIVQDAGIDTLVSTAKADPRWLASKQFRTATYQAVEKELRARYGTEIMDAMPLTKGGKPVLHSTGKKAGTPIVHSRVKRLAKVIVDQDDWRKGGIFTNHPLVDAQTYLHAMANKLENASAVKNTVARAAFNTPDGVKVSRVMKELGFGGKNRNNFVDSVLVSRGQLPIAQQIAHLTSKTAAEEATRKILKTVMDERLPMGEAQDILQNRKFAFQDAPELAHVGRLYSNYTALWKTGQLTWPARYVRDLSSALVRLWERGALDPQSLATAQQIVHGGVAKGLTDAPAIVNHLKRQGFTGTITDDVASDALRDLYAAYVRNKGGVYGELAGRGKASGGGVDLEGLTANLPGMQPATVGGDVASLGRQAAGFDPATGKWSAKRAFDVRGVRGYNDAREATLGLAGAGDRIGEYTDTMGRMTGFVNRLKQGFDPEVAAKEINFALVDYNPRNFTPTDRRLRAIFPFYSYMKNSIPYLANELALNPAGRLSQGVRVAGRAQSQDQFLPEHVAQTTAIPLPFTRESGDKPFITGFGLMHEDPLQFFGSGTKGAAAEVISRSSPLIQKPIEWATGQSFYQRGPLGGRSIDDLDPTIGRTLSNIGELAGVRQPEQGPVRFPFQKPVEFVASSLPISRALTTARTATDTRKDPASKLANLLTGWRITDVSPATQDRVLKDAATALGRQLKAREFSSIRFSKEQIADMQASDPQSAALAEAFNELQNELAGRAKERSKKR